MYLGSPNGDPANVARRNKSSAKRKARYPGSNLSDMCPVSTGRYSTPLFSRKRMKQYMLGIIYANIRRMFQSPTPTPQGVPTPLVRLFMGISD